MHVHTFMFAYGFICTHMQVGRPEVDPGCLPQVIFTLVFDMGSFTRQQEGERQGRKSEYSRTEEGLE